MVEISILLPALSHPSPSPSSLTSLCQLTFGLPSDLIDCYALVPLAEFEGEVDQVAVRLRPSTLSMQAVEDLLVQRDQLTEQLERTREALYTLSAHLDKLKKSSEEVDREKYHKRGLKLKQLDQDNKKLRQLLKTQLENSENLRVETQQTVETLRQEFEMLVKELMTFRKKEAQVTNSGQGENKARRPVPKLDIAAAGRDKT